MKKFFLVIFFAGFFGAVSFNKTAAHSETFTATHTEAFHAHVQALQAYAESLQAQDEALQAQQQAEEKYITDTCALAFENVKTIEDLCEATLTIITSHPNYNNLFCPAVENDTLAIQWVTALKQTFQKYESSLSLEDCKEWARTNTIPSYFFVNLRSITYLSGGRIFRGLEIDPQIEHNDVFTQEEISLTEEERVLMAAQQKLGIKQQRADLLRQKEEYSRQKEAYESYLLALQTQALSPAKRSKVDTPGDQPQPPL